MPRKTISRKGCRVCGHAHRHEIEMSRVAGVGLEALSAKYGVSTDSVWRHCRNHLSEDERALYLADAPLAEIAERAAKEGGSLLSYFALVRSTVISQMLLASSSNDGHRTAVLAGRAVEVLREIGRLTGELSKINSLTINNNSAVFINSPIFAELEAMLISKLSDFPEALAAVVDGLRTLEAASGSEDVPGSPDRLLIEGNLHAAGERLQPACGQPRQ
jgi:hypothetical protein